MRKPPKKLRLPGDPIETNPSPLGQWATWRMTVGGIALYVIYKAIDLGFEKLGG